MDFTISPHWFYFLFQNQIQETTLHLELFLWFTFSLIWWLMMFHIFLKTYIDLLYILLCEERLFSTFPLVVFIFCSQELFVYFGVLFWILALKLHPHSYSLSGVFWWVEEILHLNKVQLSNISEFLLWLSGNEPNEYPWGCGFNPRPCSAVKVLALLWAMV